MLLYNKLQEFQQSLERLENDNTKTYEYAQTQLKTELSEALSEAENRISSELLNDLNTQEKQMQENVKEYALSLFTQKSDEIVEKLTQTIPTDSIQEQVVQSLISNAEPNLNKAFKEFLDLNAQDLSQSHRQELQEIITQKVREAVNANANSITQEVIKELDFSFLCSQPQVFYEVIINSMGELLTKKCENEYLQEYFKTMGKSIYDDIADLEQLQEAEFLSQLHLVSMSGQNEYKSLCEVIHCLQEQEMKEKEMQHKAIMLQKAQELEIQKLENAIALEAKRKELIESGAIPSEEIATKSYKVV